jgi:hypothetical protein
MPRFKVITVCACLLTLLVILSSKATIPLTANPVWQAQLNNYPTGLGWGDINNDGWLDLVIGAGLDVFNRPNVIYINDNGAISTAPGWTSDDAGPHDNLCLGDLNKDGYLDLIVSCLGLTSTGLQPVPHEIYLSNSSIVSTTAGWLSQPANSFSCAIGDPNGDGYLDVAFAQGDYATNHRQPAVLYFNNQGAMETTPGWQSDSLYYGVEASFADVDNDGDLDLAIGGRLAFLALFFNTNGVLETTPSWQTHQIIGARQMAFADVDHDGDLDVAVAEIAGGIHLFENNAGILDTLPSWSYTGLTQPSCVAWGDVDADGDLELAAGAWYYQRMGVFDNVNGALTDTFSWFYDGAGWMQQIAWGDYDNSGLVDTTKSVMGDGQRKVFYMDKMPLHAFNFVTVNGTPLTPTRYCINLVDGWVSLDSAFVLGDILTFAYTFSRHLDLAISADAALIFQNTQIFTGMKADPITPKSYNTLQSHPNPFNIATKLTFELTRPGEISLTIYDLKGAEIVRLIEGYAAAGKHELWLDGSGLCSGIYFARLITKDSQKTQKLLLLK